jgi:hypothetical protein
MPVGRRSQAGGARRFVRYALLVLLGLMIQRRIRPDSGLIPLLILEIRGFELIGYVNGLQRAIHLSDVVKGGGTRTDRRQHRWTFLSSAALTCPPTALLQVEP